MTLFAAGIVVVLRLFSGALRLSAGSRDASASAIYAGQRMEEALIAPNPVEGVEQGAFGDAYRWEVATAFVPQEGEAPYDEIRLRVTVRWFDGEDQRSVDLFATRWRWKGAGEGILAMGGGQLPAGGVPWSGALPQPGSGVPPKPGSGFLPDPGGGVLPDPGIVGDPEDYLAPYVRRRLVR
jgi:hypothetical protein